MTTGGYSGPKINMMSGEQLVVLLVANGIGVSKRSYELIELGESEEA